MIKSLKDARIVDGLPCALAKQPWVQALSKAMSVVHEMTMAFADSSQIYTNIEKADESVLDALAVNWKIDWYDTGYNIEQKRQTVKTALTVRRTMGTVAAVKAQADAIYPGTTLEEWFEWGGEPGLFRMCVNVSATGHDNTIDIFDQTRMERHLTTAKRFSAHLENISYQVRNSVSVSAAMTDVWMAKPPLCGTIRCGMLPEKATLGLSVNRTLLGGGENVVVAYVGAPPKSGVNRCGTLP